MAKTRTSWKKGQSGNPKGRPPRPVSEIIAKGLSHSPDKLIAKLEAAALEGDGFAAKYLLDRVYPQNKTTAPVVSIPALADCQSSLTDKAHSILEAVGAGQIPPDVGKDLLTALSGVVKIVEIDDIMKRLDILESQADAQD